MGGCCNKKSQADSDKKLGDKKRKNSALYFSHIKSSVFCAVKGHFIFQLALVSYINYSLRYLLLKQQNSNGALTEKYRHLKKSAAFSMIRNIIPFFEVAIIMPLVCFGIPRIPGVGDVLQDHMYLYCTLICITFMIAICFTVRALELREKLTKCFYKDYDSEKIKGSFKQDDIHYPIYEDGNLMFNFPDCSNYKGKQNASSRGYFILLTLLNLITLPLKLIQATTMLSLAIIEFGEAIFNFPFDILTCYNDKDKFAATKNGLKRSGYLFYGFIRNAIDITFFPVMVFVNSHYQKNMSSPFECLDNAVAELIGEVKSTCCNA
ncbi:MAG: hypothetical protein sL5_05230 [Candidatus Mesenet longicola]|uniref:Uncharacterized protein n=1 Tax=Candidatus Mesenet longicola TaxID=1892558 RepID=A0A8J3HV85_9RICK|nr:MAG: hypothetical protein sGL2_05320 [Candidatus Mesenet longicola]GHM59530.1 MAG: hypothetical protein sL5_05230 [Candidatus Mesenet longicola]